jgi:hypothetical protein
MSLGHSSHFRDVRVTSGLPLITNIAGADRGVSDLSDTDSFSDNFRTAN